MKKRSLLRPVSLPRFCLALLALSGLMDGITSAEDPVEPLWIIDTHTHFKGKEQIALESKTRKFDPRNTLGHVVKPEDYRELANRLNIQATVVVEAVDQDQHRFNDWVLEQAKSDLICGYIARGNLASNDFVSHHERYKATGYLRGYRFRREELQGYLQNEVAQSNLKRLEQDGMIVDLLISDAQAQSVVTLARAYPKLIIVVDHCFRQGVKGPNVTPQWSEAVAMCGTLPNVHCKLSSVLNFLGTKAFGAPAPNDLEAYRPILQTCYDSFGEDRLMFATNWGVCTHFGEVDDVVRIVAEFAESQGEGVMRKVMRNNAIRIFKIRDEHLR
ncbi:MAG: amidohydrolase [Pirellulaceae bacterium]